MDAPWPVHNEHASGVVVVDRVYWLALESASNQNWSLFLASGRVLDKAFFADFCRSTAGEICCPVLLTVAVAANQLSVFVVRLSLFVFSLRVLGRLNPLMQFEHTTRLRLSI